MSAPLNDRDVLLQLPGARYTPPTNRGLFLATTAPGGFKVAANGTTATPSSIDISAVLIGMSGNVTFTPPAGVTLTGAGNTRTLTFANMTPSTAVVTVAITVDNVLYSRDITITKTSDGATGPAGATNVIVYAYQRSASAPAGSPGIVTVDLVAKAITTATLANGWLKSIPSPNGNPLYVTAATASGTGATDDIAANEWSAGAIQAQDGAQGTTGAPGLNSATVTLYQRTTTSTPPALPSVATTYTFASSLLAGANNGWTQAMPPTSAGAFLHVTTSTAISDVATDNIAAAEWSAAKVIAIDIGSKAGVINDDPLLENVENAWVLQPGVGVGTNGYTAPSAAGARYFQSLTADARVYSARVFLINPNKTYSLTANLFASGGNNRWIILYVDFYDAAGSFVSTGWGGTESGYTFTGLPSPDTWSRQGGQFGAGVAGRAIPSNVASARIGVWFQYSANGSGTVTQDAQDIRLELAADNIAPGAVINSPIINNPTLDAFHINALADANGSVFKPKALVIQQTATCTGGKGPYKFSWNLVVTDQQTPSVTMAIDSTGNGDTNNRIKLYGLAQTSNGTSTLGYVECTAVEGIGRSDVTRFNFTVDC